jgi:hypothetical protein
VIVHDQPRGKFRPLLWRAPFPTDVQLAASIPRAPITNSDLELAGPLLSTTSSFITWIVESVPSIRSLTIPPHSLGKARGLPLLQVYLLTFFPLASYSPAARPVSPRLAHIKGDHVRADYLSIFCRSLCHARSNVFFNPRPSPPRDGNLEPSGKPVGHSTDIIYRAPSRGPGLAYMGTLTLS